MSRPELMRLLDACKQEPEDAVRLVLADWLEENGGDADRARATVIRLQVEEGRGGPPYRLTVAELCRRHMRDWLGLVRGLFKVLPDCERGLLRAVGPKLSAAPAGLADSEEWAWVESVWEAGVRPLRSPLLATVPTLSLTCHGMPPAARRELAEARVRPRRLLLHWWPAGAGMTEALFRSPLAAGLESLSVNASPLGTEGVAVLAGSEQLAGLRRLSLEGCRLGDAAVEGLTRSPWLRRLRSLALHDGITGAGLSALCAAEPLAGLRSLALDGNRDIGGGVLQPASFQETLEELTLARCGMVYFVPPHGLVFPRLRRLDLSSNLLSAGAFAALAAGPLLRGLHSLHLDGNPIGPPGAAAIAGIGPGPRSLHLGGCVLGDEGVARLAAWPGLSGVEWLSLGANGIGPAGTKALAESPHAARLRALDLSGNPIGDEGAAALLGTPLMGRLCWLRLHEPASLARLLAARPPEGLRELDLGRKAGRGDLAQLRRALPHCVVG